MNLLRIIKTLTHILLTIIIILFIITGFGITNYQIIESLTLGGLSKPLSFQIHTNLILPLIILLVLHISFSIGNKIQKENHS
ncbi:MAG TPA: hypothetical protein VN377_06725 [Candidatus Thermoplasmatota archaeon]|nr:hypothetical protein [Candidatus Thermoplasmatota archaeon]